MPPPGRARASRLSLSLMLQPCPFCALPPERIIEQTPLALAIRDGFPVSPGHTLIIPRRHVGSFFEITAEEQASRLALLPRARVELATRLVPFRGGFLA